LHQAELCEQKGANRLIDINGAKLITGVMIIKS
ncbi:hypothetical protein Smp_198860, partial [Schistosoma mansoni]